RGDNSTAGSPAGGDRRGRFRTRRRSTSGRAPAPAPRAPRGDVDGTPSAPAPASAHSMRPRRRSGHPGGVLRDAGVEQPAGAMLGAMRKRWPFAAAALGIALAVAIVWLLVRGSDGDSRSPSGDTTASRRDRLPLPRIDRHAGAPASLAGSVKTK